MIDPTVEPTPEFTAALRKFIADREAKAYSRALADVRREIVEQMPYTTDTNLRDWIRTRLDHLEQRGTTTTETEKNSPC